VAGDLTGDGRDDLLVAIPEEGQVLLVRGRSDGLLTAPPASDVYQVTARTDPAYTFPPPVASIDVADVDGNESIDVVAGFDGFDQSVQVVAVLTNDGHGALTKATTVPVAHPRELLLVPLGGDDDPDLVVVSTFASTDSLSVVPGAAESGFGPAVTRDLAGAHGLAAGDFNQDGAADVVVGRGSGQPPVRPPQILPGRPDAPTLGQPVTVPAPFSTVPLARVAVADLDRDGHDDVIVEPASSAITSPTAR
jgi:hypothetical protein